MVTPLHLLIVEDSAADAELVVLRLKNEGYQLDWQCVQTEVDYIAALDMNPELILSDWSLPHFSGLRALQIIRERDLETPFIIISGSIGEESAVSALRQGAYDYLLKDRPERLGQAVQNALEQKRLRDQRKLAEQALKEEQYLLRTLMDTMPDTIYFKDAQSRYIRINPALANILGVDEPKQAIGKTEFDFFGTEHAQASDNNESEIIRSGQPLINLEEFVVDPGGLTEWVSTTKMPLRDQQGEIIGTFGISRNITRRKLAEKQLQESQRFAQATIDALTAHLCVLDENGVILAVNQAWRNFGEANPPVPPGYFVGSNYLEVCDAAQGPNSAEAARVAEGLHAVMRAERKQFSLEYPCNTPGGEKRWFTERITRFAGEGPLRIVVVHENITERKLVEEALRDSEERYRKLIEASHELIFTHDLELNVLSMNPAMEKLLGISAVGMKGLNLYKITPVSKHQDFVSYIQAITKEGIQSGRWSFLTSQDDLRVLDYQSTLIEQTDQMPLVRCMAQDVTEKVHHEQELEAIAALSSALRSLAPDESILPTILQELNKLVIMDGLAISLLDIENSKARVELSAGEWKNWSGALAIPNEGVFGKVYETRRPFIDEKVSSRKSSDWPGALGKIQSVLCLPLISNDQFIGALWLGRTKTFSKRDIRILTTLSDISANAIRNLALYKQEEERAATLASLYNVGLAINSVLEPQVQLEILFKIAMTELQAERMVFLRYLPENAGFKAEFCLGFQEELQMAIYQTPYPLEEIHASMGYEFVNELPVNIPNIQGNTGHALGDPFVSSVLWVPVKHANQLRGLLGVMSTKINAFDQNQERLLVLFANQAAVALENASLISETRQQIERLKSLHSIDETINASLDLSETSKVLLEQVRLQLNVDAADVLSFSPITNSFDFINGYGFKSPVTQFADSSVRQKLANRVLNHRKTTRFSDLGSQNNALASSAFFKEEHFVEYIGVPLISKGIVKGMLELFQRSPLQPDEAWLDFMETIGGQAAIAVDNIEMFENLQRSNRELTLAYDATIAGWSQAMDLRDKETEGHTLRVTEMTIKLAKALGLPKEALVHIRRGALLHDIGKLGVPDQILLKPAALDEVEWELMKKHPEYAYQMLSPIEYLRPALDIPYCHHEKWDGTGYPRGLKGVQIPLTARIFAVVDVWDALSSNRPYRPAWAKAEVLSYLQEQAGKNFDPDMVTSFLKLLEEES